MLVLFIKVIKRKTLLLIISSILSVILAISAPTAIYTASKQNEEEKKFIKWVDFGVPYEALSAALEIDIATHSQDGQTPLDWVDMLAYLASKYGGDFSHFKKSDLTKLTETLKKENTTIDALGSSLKTYSYFKEAYGAVLNGFVGPYAIETVHPDNCRRSLYG